ncbi:F0F1 ATP synthase subunit A [Sphaerisporangium sp. TRM90804]|uniref:F0F1 ATP synthase subunit A n=1 Tax=Sphaerisporangium sp. TRM90804 TaxID=3031113 RepID=UPI00244BC5FD|nr:F0F1 ATP synthase subunit A [Sphaerisporangium sp. TRM90804]MDH2429969.1 F0F1 ATP synthase subunit A [Sphaerisporangium sp. TRM90804]
MSALTVLADGDFVAPGPSIFNFPPLWPGAPEWATKPVLFAMVGALLVVALGWSAFAKPKLVPRGMQNIGELGYLFVRDQVARPFLGKDAERWMPLLVPIFFLVFAWNLMGVIPGIQFPIASHIAFPVVLALAIYVIKLYLGIKHQGFGGYIKNLFPSGLPKPVYIILVPLELLQNFVTAPFTHAVRLFANMFAGHMILAFFSAVGFWFLFENLTPLGAPIGVLGVVMAILMTGFEIFIQYLQAFLFTLLAAMYIGASLHPDH